MSNTTAGQDNFLSCGYLREYEDDTKIMIPNVVQDIVASYCKECKVYGVGFNTFPNHTSQNKLINQPDDIFPNGYGTVIKNGITDLRIKNKKDSNLVTLCNYQSVSVVSSGVGNDSALYIYTINGSLYKSEMNLKSISTFKKIDTSFLGCNDKIIDIKCGKDHTLFLTEFGNVYTCGLNDVGQCGFNKDKFPKIPTPKLVINSREHNIISIAVGAFHSLALNSENQLICFGYNICGQIGVTLLYCTEDDDESDTFPAEDNAYDTTGFDDIFSFVDESDDETESEEQINAMLSVIDKPIINEYFEDLNIKIIKIYAGKHHSLCISDNGKAYTFGQNVYGNLGNGISTNYGVSNSIPYEISNEFGYIIDGSCGENHNLLLNKQNNVICFGNNSKNQCSKTDIANIVTPMFVTKKSLGINDNSFIEKVTCLKNESLVFVDVYKRS